MFKEEKAVIPSVNMLLHKCMDGYVDICLKEQMEEQIFYFNPFVRKIAVPTTLLNATQISGQERDSILKMETRAKYLQQCGFH